MNSAHSAYIGFAATQEERLHDRSITRIGSKATDVSANGARLRPAGPGNPLRQLEQAVGSLARQAEVLTTGAGDEQGTDVRRKAGIDWLRKIDANRDAVFGPNCLSGTAWRILIELYSASLGGRRICVSEIATSAGLPMTTLLRWLSELERQELINRAPDLHDKRRAFISLTDDAFKKTCGVLDASFN